MAKWLFFGLLVFVAYLMLRGSRLKSVRRSKQTPASSPVQQMVACDHCGVHLPENESLQAFGQHYCCEAHRAAGQGGRGHGH